MSARKHDHIWATGRRKTSVAQARMVPDGACKVTINKLALDAYFRGLERHQKVVLSPINVVPEAKTFDYILKIFGGGMSGQAGAARHAIARALVKLDEKNRKLMRAEGFLTRDPRMVERKKSGQPKARKRFQYSKR
jgi:small subunit ribosomal protein S9